MANLKKKQFLIVGSLLLVAILIVAGYFFLNTKFNNDKATSFTLKNCPVPDKYCSLAQIQYDDDGNPIAIYWTPGDLPEGTSVYAPCTGEMLRPGEYEEGVLHIPFYMWSEELEQTVGLYVWFENAHSAVFETDDFGVYEVDGGEFLTTVTSEVINEETGANLMVTSSEPWTTGTLIKNTDI
jgi:hypothetical protein